MYPDQVPAEAVIESSDIENKEKIIDQLNEPVTEPVKPPRTNELKKNKLKMSEGFVNTIRQPSSGILK